MRIACIILVWLAALAAAAAARADQAVSPAADAVTFSVRVDKLFLLPGQTQFAYVIAHNSGDTAADAPFTVSINWDIGQSRQVGAGTLHVAPQGDANISVPFPAGPERGGYEVRANLTGAPDSEAVTDYFSVDRDIWRGSLQGSGLSSQSMSDPMTTDAFRAAAAEGARGTLCNTTEFFAWAPDDFGTLDPQTDVWYAGQTSYAASKLSFHEAIDAIHAAGATVSAYAKGQMGGPAAIDFFQRHPGWTSAPYNSSWSVLDLKAFSAKSPFDIGDNVWPRSMTDFGSWPIAYEHIKQLRLAVNEFRFDAVRYDDHLQVGWVNGGYNAMSARNMEQIVDRMRLARPYFAFGFNWVTDSLKGIWAAHGNQPTPDWPIAGAVGGQFMDEEIGQIYGSYRPAAGLPWTNYLARLRQDRDMVEPYGGKVFIMQNARLDPVDSVYRNAVVLAMRLYHTNFDASNRLPVSLAPFAIRYGAILHPDKPADFTAGDVTVTSPQAMWGADMAYRYMVANGHGRAVVPLIVAPLAPNIGQGIGSGMPPAAANVRVQVSLPSWWSVRRAVAIDAGTLAVTPLSTTGGAVDVTVPQVGFWTELVVDCGVTQ